jgi:protein-L-isoaspartate(D-aspartate) O-methyltransferase
MDDLTQARINMVENQIRPNDVTDLRIQRAMRTVPRELFVPKTVRSLAYSEERLEVAPGRRVMEPRILAKMIQATDIQPTDLVLLVGASTGYAAAIVSYLAAAVVALEEDESLAESAAANFSHLNIDTIAVVTAPLDEGHAPQAPYDAILIDGGVEFIPEALGAQLAEGGRLIAPQVDGAVGAARLYERTGEAISSRYLFDATVPLLPGFTEPREFAL